MAQDVRGRRIIKIHFEVEEEPVGEVLEEKVLVKGGITKDIPVLSRTGNKSPEDFNDSEHFLLISLRLLQNSRLISLPDKAIQFTTKPGQIRANLKNNNTRADAYKNLLLQTTMDLTREVKEADEENSLWEPFYRYHRNEFHVTPSASPYQRGVGIRCPGWRRGGSAESEECDTIRTCIQQHLRDNDRSSPPFISVSDSPARIYNIITADRERTAESTSIIVISRMRFSGLGVWFEKTTDLIDDYRIPKWSRQYPDGCQYVTDSHWLIHRWLPQACIVLEMDLNQFALFCKDSGAITELEDADTHAIPQYSRSGRYNYEAIRNFDRRPLLKEILEFKAKLSAGEEGAQPKDETRLVNAEVEVLTTALGNLGLSSK